MPHKKTPEILADAEKRVLAMRKEKKGRKEIAGALGIRLWQLDGIVSSLIARGLTEKRQGSQTIAGGRAANLADPRTALIIAMRRDHRTYEEIRVQVSREFKKKITRSRVQQIVARIEELHGVDALAPQIPAWSPHEAARVLEQEGCQASYTMIMALCEAGEIDCLDRPRQDARFLITKQGMAQLRAHPRITQKRQCVICGENFTGKKEVCSEKCHKTRERNKYRERGAHAADPKRLTRLYRSILQAIPIMGGRYRWVSWGEAMRIAGITGTQLDYLASMKIISVQSDAERTWRGRPRRRYAAEEMRIVRDKFRYYEKSGTGRRM